MYIYFITFAIKMADKHKTITSKMTLKTTYCCHLIKTMLELISISL